MCVRSSQYSSTTTVDVQCVNRFEPLSSDDECVDVIAVEEKVKAVTGNKCERKLRIGTWNFAGLCSERKEKEVGQVLEKLLMARNRGRWMALLLV